MNMIIEEQQQDVQIKQQIYLQRVNQLYANIKNWLQDEPLILEESKTDVIEALGHYQAPKLSIKTQAGEQLAEFKPTGTSALLAEGSIDVKGWLDREYVVYMLESHPQTYYKIDADGWYWQEQRVDVDPHFLDNKTTLLQLITWVSDYEF